MSDLRFDGKNGRTPSAQARRYIYERLAVMLKEDMYQHPPPDGGSFVLRHIDNEFDERRVRKEAQKVISELHRKACR